MTWPNITLKRGITQSDGLLNWLNKSSGEQFAANGNKLDAIDGSDHVDGTGRQATTRLGRSTVPSR